MSIHCTYVHVFNVSSAALEPNTGGNKNTWTFMLMKYVTSVNWISRKVGEPGSKFKGKQWSFTWCSGLTHHFRVEMVTSYVVTEHIEETVRIKLRMYTLILFCFNYKSVVILFTCVSNLSNLPPCLQLVEKIKCEFRYYLFKWTL